MQGIGYTNGLRSEKPMVWWGNPEINSFRKLPPCPGWEDKRKRGHDHPEELDPWWHHMAGAGAIPFLSEMLPEGEREREMAGLSFSWPPVSKQCLSPPRSQLTRNLEKAECRDRPAEKWKGEEQVGEQKAQLAHTLIQGTAISWLGYYNSLLNIPPASIVMSPAARGRLGSCNKEAQQSHGFLLKEKLFFLSYRSVGSSALIVQRPGLLLGHCFSISLGIAIICRVSCSGPLLCLGSGFQEGKAWKSRARISFLLSDSKIFTHHFTHIPLAHT